MGGMIAQHVALLATERVASLGMWENLASALADEDFFSSYSPYIDYFGQQTTGTCAHLILLCCILSADMNESFAHSSKVSR